MTKKYFLVAIFWTFSFYSSASAANSPETPNEEASELTPAPSISRHATDAIMSAEASSEELPTSNPALLRSPRIFVGESTVSSNVQMSRLFETIDLAQRRITRANTAERCSGGMATDHESESPRSPGR